MGPDYTTRSRLGPLPRRGKWLTASAFISVSLVLAGVASPAVAAAQNTDARVTQPIGGDDSCEGDPYDEDDEPYRASGGGDDYCQQGPPGPPGPTGPRGPRGETGATGPAGPCIDIDSIAPNNTEDFSAALVNGISYAGRQAAPGGPIVWQDLTDADNPNYPANVCAISISEQGNDAWIKVITATGTVFQTHGDVRARRESTCGFDLCRGVARAEEGSHVSGRAEPRR